MRVRDLDALPAPKGRVRALIRGAPQLAPVQEQRDSIVARHPSAMLFELDASLDALKLLDIAIADLRPNDILVVHDINVFSGTTGEVAQTVRNLLELGVELHVTGHGGMVLSADETLIGLLTMLSDRERRGVAIPHAEGRAGVRRRRLLSVHQTRYAKKLYEQGLALREIGLIFQASPREVWEAIQRTRAHKSAAPPEPSSD